MEGENKMLVNITSRRAKITDAFKDRVDKKLSKLDKFFRENANADVIVTNEKEDEREKVEVTIKSHGLVYRAEKITADMFDSLECAVDAIVKQIVKNKTKLEKKLRAEKILEHLPIDESDLKEGKAPEGEESYKIVKRKLYTSKPMLPDEAILQMNMIDHDFFIFEDADSGKINIVYKRKNGDYGLIVPEE